MAAEETKAQIGEWLRNVPDSIRVVFEQIWIDAPEALLNAVGGAELVGSQNTDQTFAEFVGAGDGFGPTNVAQPLLSEVVADPVRPDPGATFTVRWSGSNHGTVELPAHTIQVVLRNAAGETVDQADLTGDAVDAGGAFEGEASLTAPDQPQHCTVTVWVNSEGVDPGEVPGPQGYRSYSGIPIEVGIADIDFAGADAALLDAMTAFSHAAQDTELNELIIHVGQGLALLETLTAAFTDESARAQFERGLGRATAIAETWEGRRNDDWAVTVAPRMWSITEALNTMVGAGALNQRLNTFGGEAVDTLVEVLEEMQRS